MSAPTTTYKSKSGQLEFSVFINPNYMTGAYKDLTQVPTEEYLECVEQVGNAMQQTKTGRILLDVSQMKGFSLSMRAAAVNNVSKLMLDKAPYFVLAIIKGSNLFENLATQTALKMALPLSSKFLAGELFDNNDAGRKKALEWLLQYPVPNELTRS